MSEPSLAGNRRRRRSLGVALLASAWTFAPHPAGAQAIEPPPPPAATQPAREPLSLRRATELALAHSHDVAAAAASLRSDLAAARAAGDAFRPEAGLSTTPGVGRGLPVAVAGQIPAIISVGARQSLFNREERSKGFAARAVTAGTRGTFEMARLQAARLTSDLYGRCWADQQILRTAEERLSAYTAMTQRAQNLREQGRMTELELAQARLREARARLHRMEIAATRDADEWELRQRLGLTLEAPLELPTDPLAELPDPRHDSAAANLQAAKATDPQLTAAVRQVDLLQRARDERRGILAPVTVEADAQYSRLSRANGIDQFYVKFRDDDWSVALAVAFPLWTGGRLRDNQARAEANLERVKEQQRSREAELAIDLHRAESTLAHAEAALGVARQATAVAEEDLRVSQALSAEGRALPDDLDSRAAALADGHEEEIKATASLLTARVQLLAARGDLFERLGVSDSNSQPPSTTTPATLPPTHSVGGEESGS